LQARVRRGLDRRLSGRRYKRKKKQRRDDGRDTHMQMGVISGPRKDKQVQSTYQILFPIAIIKAHRFAAAQNCSGRMQVGKI
jgi:hypothetical protein